MRYAVRRLEMAKVQTQFDNFNDEIRLRRFEDNKTLREKRDIIIQKLKDRLPGVFEKYGEECPTFWFADQGSYKMGTGVKPLDGNLDIDQGMFFAISTSKYDPVVLKQRVHEALDGHTDSVVIRRSCVTVYYHCDGEAIYHVDVAVYSDGVYNTDGKHRLARGKITDPAEKRTWDVSDPAGLADKLVARFDENGRDQFRHIIRYLKRWKAVNFESMGNAAPLGIALTVATSTYLTPQYTDYVTYTPDEHTAMRGVVDSMLNAFTKEWDDDEQVWVRRLKINLPVETWSDLFARMTNKQMHAFEDKLKALKTALDDAASEVDPVVACEGLQGVFGGDFPIPPKEETAKSHAPAISTSGRGA